MLADVQARAAKSPAPGVSSARQPGRLLANGELHLRTKQYEAAIDDLELVVELATQGKASVSAGAEADLLLADAYFDGDQLLSARHRYELVLGRAGSAESVSRAAVRLVDIAYRADRPDTLPDLLARIERMLAERATGELHYARAKALFALGRYDEAVQASGAATGTEVLALRAAYLRGTALVKVAQAAVGEGEGPKKVDYSAALREFDAAARLPATTPQGVEVRDLAQLAVARLHFEGGQLLKAESAYSRIGSSSKHFAEALFELAWTYVRLGDVERSRRALDALRVLHPGLIDGADAALMRADLMLRAGRFREAEAAYDEVRAIYEPLRRAVDDYLAKGDDPGRYYDDLTSTEVELGQKLPALVVEWAREEATEDRLFALADEVARSRDLVQRTRRLAALLTAALSTKSRAKLFPELLAQAESTLGLINELAAVRLVLARGLDGEAGRGTPELEKVRSERRRSMARVAQLPMTPGDFSVRTAAAEARWYVVAEELQRLELDANHTQALANGLRRVLLDGDRFGLVVDAATRQRYQSEIDDNERALAAHRARIEELRRGAEMGRAGVGLGDEQFEEDERARVAFNRAFSAEVALVASAKDDSPGAVQYAKRIAPLLARIATIEATLGARRAQLDTQIGGRSEDLARQLTAEVEAVEATAREVESLGESARMVVGAAARDNFIRVRDRLRGVVMRSEVGIVQKSWEVRELQQSRVRALLRERAREERVINDELQEVLDDGGIEQ